MSETPADLIEQVREITGCTEIVAKTILAACNNEVQAAITLFFEGDGIPETVSEEGSDGIASHLQQQDSVIDSSELLTKSVTNAAENDEVRAPIKPIREQLVAPLDDNFLATTSAVGPTSTHPGSSHMMRNARRIKVCPLRDFAREGALLEQQLQSNEGGVPFDTVSHFSKAGQDNCKNISVKFPVNSLTSTVFNIGGHHNQEPKRKRLEDLYRPPTDIAYAGTFQAARNRAEAVQHWMLVNVQSDNFDSQLLNRDVWSDTALRKLIRKQFLLWQVDADTSEGRRFVTFYHCNKLPYLCVIDPRTGEEVWKSTKPTQATVFSDLKNFLKTHKDFAHEMKETSPLVPKPIYSLDSSSEEDPCDGIHENGCNDRKSGNKSKKSQQLTELTEEEQLALAIRNSIEENGTQNKEAFNDAHGNPSKRRCQNSTKIYISDSDEDDDDVSEMPKVISEKCVPTDNKSYEEMLGVLKTEITTLKVRLFSSDGSDQLVQLQWPSDTPLLALREYIAQKHTHIPKTGYKLICAFPKKTLDASYDEKSLKDCGLHPSANLHITLDD